MMHYFQSNVTEMEQVRGGNGNVTYTGVKTYHQDLDQSRGGSSGNGSGGGNNNYVSTSSKYQQSMSSQLVPTTTRQVVNNDQLSEMERAHAKYQIEMEMARQKYQSEIEQAASKYQSEIEQARGNVGSFINMKYQQVSADDVDKVREQEVHYKYQNGSNTFTEVKYQNAFRPSPDLQQQQNNIPVNTNYGSPMEYHQSPNPANNNAGVANNTVSSNPPAKKRKKKPVDLNKIRKRCIYQRRMWTNDEREAVMRQLGEFLATNRLPGKKDIEEALQREDILATRSWKNIKDFIRNKTSPRIPRHRTVEQPLPTQVPMVQAGGMLPQGSSTVTLAGNMVVASTLGEMVTIPITSQGQQLAALDSKLGLMSAQQQHIQQQQQIQLQQQQQQHPHQSTMNSTTTSKKKKKKMKESPEGKQRRVISRRDWSGAEKAAVLHYFGDYVARQKLPGKKDIEDCLQKEEILSFRSWRNVKDFIRNSAQARIKREAIFGTGNPDFALLS